MSNDTSTTTKKKLEFVYAPEGGTEKRWPFEPRKMDNRETILIEELTGWTFLEWQDQYLAGSVKAAHALLWTYLRRTHSDLDPDSVVFTYDEVTLVEAKSPTASPEPAPVPEPEPGPVEVVEEGKAESEPPSVSDESVTPSPETPPDL